MHGLRSSVFLAMVCLALAGCTGPGNAPAPPPVEITGGTMGTTYSIKFIGDTPTEKAPDTAAVSTGIKGILKEVNNQMSTYDAGSEISRFNRHKEIGWFPVSLDFARVVSDALQYSRLSSGAFDITVGPLVNLWGFGPIDGDRDREPPAEEDIAEALGHVGFERVGARLTAPAIKKNDPDVYIDLSAIAKGFGVDRVSAYLESEGIGDYLVEIGGEVRAKGTNHLGQAWRVGITTPDGGYDIEMVVSLTKEGLATSGDYRNHFEKDGKRYSHTIDPRTGRPVTHQLVSVSVITDTCTRADAMATALVVLGPEKGFQLALDNGLAALFIVTQGEGFTQKMTPEFKPYLD